MKVIAFNGSPHAKGNTYLLLRHVLGEVEREGIETELAQVGGKKVRPCTACGKCFQNKDRKCVLTGDMVNESIEKMAAADAIIVGSPTYFTGVTPEIKAFLDRTFYVSLANGNLYQRKLGAAVAAVRRAGAVMVVDTIQHYFGITGMYSAGSIYWNLGVGLEQGDVENDDEGVRTTQELGRNVAWFLKNIRKD